MELEYLQGIRYRQLLKLLQGTRYRTTSESSHHIKLSYRAFLPHRIVLSPVSLGHFCFVIKKTIQCLCIKLTRKNGNNFQNQEIELK